MFVLMQMLALLSTMLMVMIPTSDGLTQTAKYSTKYKEIALFGWRVLGKYQVLTLQGKY